jgi:sulfoxide reductase heme-binding subunit YedZ
MAYIKKNWFVWVVNIAAMIPLLLLLWDAFTGQLIDPIGQITNRTGYTALVLLVISLASTPLITLTGFRRGVVVRKWAGLQGFFYVCLHLFTFIGLDYAFNLSQILGDAVLTKRYVLVGFSAFLLLVPLAITSTKGWMRRLGRNWKRLHRLIYLAVPLAVLHFIWSQKIPTEPLVYAAVVALLLLARVPPVRQRLNAVRRKLDGIGKSARSPRRSAPVRSEIA